MEYERAVNNPERYELVRIDMDVAGIAVRIKSTSSSREYTADRSTCLCTCEFSATMLLPYRRVMWHRRQSGESRIIPIRCLHPR